VPGKEQIVVAAPMYPPTLETLAGEFVTHLLFQAKDRAAFLAPLRDRVTAIATIGEVGADGALMDALPKAKIIASNSVGVDAIDLAAAKARGVAVTNTPGVLTDCVADLGMALTLAVARRVAEADRYVRAGKWLEGPLGFGTKLGGKTMGIVGMGRIGQALAQRAAAFGMKVAYHSRRRKSGVAAPYYEDLAELAKASDFLVLILPGGAATRNLVDARILAALGSRGFLINIARGSVVDEAALVKALQDGVIAGAGLDVFADEPRVPASLLAMENVVLQPHQGSATHETRTAMGQLMIDNLKAHFAGKPLLTPVG
jgi:lactate dehydrogenase-like 2-hydroxyacid dehydrogenase